MQNNQSKNVNLITWFTEDPPERKFVYVKGKFIRGVYCLINNTWYSEDTLEEDEDYAESCSGYDRDAVEKWTWLPDESLNKDSGDVWHYCIEEYPEEGKVVYCVGDGKYPNGRYFIENGYWYTEEERDNDECYWDNPVINSYHFHKWTDV